MKVTTKTGDDKTTFLIKRRAKDDIRVEVLGLVDEMIANFLLFRLENIQLSTQFDEIIHHFDSIMICLAMEGATFHQEYISYLEEQNELHKSVYENLNHFVKAETILAAKLNLLRTNVRTLERRFITLAREENVEPSVLIYLNRLSDYLFIQMLVANQG